MKRTICAITGVFLVLLAPSWVWGQSDGGGEPASMDEEGVVGARPWAEGIDPEDQAEAQRLFAEGNELLKDSLFPKAVEKYREALSHWNHPAIHFNLALALRTSDDPVALYKSLEEAMRYGPAPLTMQTYNRAMDYKDFVSRQVARVDISCDEPGAKVALNGVEVIASCPGKYQDLVRVGEHTVIATKPGYVTWTRTRDLDAGATEVFDIELKTPRQLTRYRRKLPAWVPWAVVTAGLAAGGTGGLFHLSSQKNFDAFDAEIDACGGCQPDAEILSIRERGDTQQIVAIASYTLGAAALTTGLILVYVNRAQPYRIDEQDGPNPARRVTVVPSIGRDGAGVTAAIRF